MTNPNAPLTVIEKSVFGTDARRHPQLGFVLEQGHGAPSVAEQAAAYLARLRLTEGEAAYTAARRAAGLPPPQDALKAAAAAAVKNAEAALREAELNAANAIIAAAAADAADMAASGAPHGRPLP